MGDPGKRPWTSRGCPLVDGGAFGRTNWSVIPLSLHGPPKQLQEQTSALSWKATRSARVRVGGGDPPNQTLRNTGLPGGREGRYSRERALAQGSVLILRRARPRGAGSPRCNSTKHLCRVTGASRRRARAHARHRTSAAHARPAPCTRTHAWRLESLTRRRTTRTNHDSLGERARKPRTEGPGART